MEQMIEQDLVSFGNYLLSKDRKSRVKKAGLPPETLENRLMSVSHADFENWKTSAKSDK